MSLRICFVAPSSFGKSTAVKLLKEMNNCECIKIAGPLYELQERFYKKIGVKMNGQQDGELLQFLGYKIRKENPEYLLKVFEIMVNECCCDIILNDDCRPMDYDYLKQMGFVFVRINGIKRDRVDHRKSDNKSSLEWQEEIPCDYEVDNYGNMNEYRENLRKIMEVIKNDRQVLCYTRRKKDIIS